MNIAALCALGVCLGYAVIDRGGVNWTDWCLTLAGTGVAGAVHFAWNLRRGAKRTRRLDPVAGLAASAVVLIAAFQLVPLPASLAGMLSPHRVEIDRALDAIGARNAATVTLSAVPHATAQYLLTMSCYFLVFLVVRDLTMRLERRPWATALPLLAVVGFEAVLGLIQVNSGLGPNQSPTGTYANRDHYAGLIEMVLPFTLLWGLAALWREKNRFAAPAAPAVKASLLFALGGAMLAAVVVSLSRMGFLCALVAAGVAGIGAVIARSHPAEDRADARAWRRSIGAGAVTAIVVVGFFLLPTNGLLARFADFAGTGDVPPNVRLDIWHDTAALVRDYPLFGCGMGSYESCFLRYKHVAPTFTVDYAHNDYLQVLAELGIFGFAAGLIFVARLIQRTAAGAVGAASLDERYVALACLAGMVAILLHSFVDFNMYVPANGMVFAWVAGIAGAHLTSTGAIT